ncbi:hypothetical protein LB534_00110 [Mesorhizobium sp. CA18]|uniref:hypothetical protein n=1 Tax=unclassified Mesorhizobium TaxID=325217 RepID=UPI001CCE9665|nr:MULTISPECIES: hypothetical protein [unclassified Mesorhizobium]MBZ9732238.1 hypothetical protein [Mesorhizobium sp. CA9]MBZ9823676.1 hypothetical protein [Mesorhizobium sp. CA18]MBZ9829904.1 hypothetical protein [Mesorhizobium sp. CA2]MBZ9835998.1 hypothetical protein [Mesorhizobium sp. CA3]MBZ9875318.1 hypothetical protein [Mesorhizobium sp. Ca11]
MTDKKLLRLEVKLNAASRCWNKATARTAAAEEEEDRAEVEQNRARTRREKAEEKEEKRAEAFVRAHDRLMNTRAKSFKGLLVKVRAREVDYCDDPALDVEFLKSLVADIKATRS